MPEIWSIAPRRTRTSAAPGARPKTLAAPSCTCRLPRRRLMAVVLPAPFGPSTPSTSPRRTSRSRSSNASTGPYRCVTRERLARVGLCVVPACIGPVYEPVVGAVSGLTGTDLVPYANPRFSHDPEMADKAGVGCCPEKPSTDCQDVIPGLASESQHHDTGVPAWRVGPDVREVLIERNEHALLTRTGGSENGVLGTAHSLVEDCHRVVAEFAEE